MNKYSDFIKQTAKDYDIPLDITLKIYNNSCGDLSFYDDLERYIKERSRNTLKG